MPWRDWLSAERGSPYSRPAVELRQKDGQFELLAALPGIEAKDIDVEITPEEVLIKAESSHENKVESGTVRLTEFGRGRVFRSVRFPEKGRSTRTPPGPSTRTAYCG